MNKEERKINSPFSSEEEFLDIWTECMENAPGASEALIKSRDAYGFALEDYIGYVGVEEFRYGYECGWNAAMKGGVQK